MDYNLAKQLKDSGFTQRFDVGKKFYSEKGATFGNVNNLTDGTDKIAIPTLSELIESCGDGFSSLVVNKIFITEWVATDNRMHGFKDSVGYVQAKGSTPEEAVSLLWLALNKK